jgi:hypothetical protein
MVSPSILPNTSARRPGSPFTSTANRIGEQGFFHYGGIAQVRHIAIERHSHALRRVGRAYAFGHHIKISEAVGILKFGTGVSGSYLL